MKHTEFIRQLDEARIVGEIAEAESRTSGEIRVYISHKERHDALTFARQRFQKLGMARTKNRNGVLIYIVPRTRQLAVIGDIAIHQKCGDAFWQKLVSGLTARMKEGRLTDAIVDAIREVGVVLSQNFPTTHDKRNELSNEIAGE